VKTAAAAAAGVGRAFGHVEETMHAPAPAVRRIGMADLREALARGLDDLGAYRSDVIFLAVIYPVVGLVLARLAWGYDMVPLLFPLASGFALVGPFVAVGLNEMSRQRERGVKATWVNAFAVVRSPAAGPVLLLGLLLVVLFAAWLAAAAVLYGATLGPQPPAAIPAFVHSVLATSQGHVLIVAGCGIGLLFALVAFAISVVSFPLLLDRDTGVDTAIATSLRVVRANPAPMALWGLIVVTGLVLGSIPLFLGLVVVMPVLGHATWHLYRRAVVPAGSPSRSGRGSA
jgi:uncharacterized membrane protein